LVVVQHCQDMKQEKSLFRALVDIMYNLHGSRLTDVHTQKPILEEEYWPRKSRLFSKKVFETGLFIMICFCLLEAVSAVHMS
jgi:hypothetical protein